MLKGILRGEFFNILIFTKTRQNITIISLDLGLKSLYTKINKRIVNKGNLFRKELDAKLKGLTYIITMPASCKTMDPLDIDRSFFVLIFRVNPKLKERFGKMKKLFSVLIAGAMIFGAGSSAFANEDKAENQAKALEMIEKTNRDIDKKIEKAVEKADELQEEYLVEIREIEKGKEIVKLTEEQKETLVELEMNRHDEKKAEKLLKKMTKIEEKLQKENEKIEQKIAEIREEIGTVTAQLVDAKDKDEKKLNKKIAKLQEKLNKKNAKAAEKTAKYTKALEDVIDKVFNETLEMSAETIEKAAGLGVQAECSWKLVRFADRWVWIDPLRVVGF